MRWTKRALMVGLLFCLAALISCGSGGNGGGGGGGTNPLVITTASLPEWYTGAPFDQTLTSTGGKAPVTWSYVGFFPMGLTLSPSGRITGTVTNAVFGDVTFIATDSSRPAQTAQKTIRMTFHWGLDLEPSTLPAAHTNAPYDAVITAGGSDADSASWQITSGTMPPGLQLKNPTPLQVEIAGTPTQVGTFNFSLQAKANTTPQVAKRDYTLTVDSSFVITTGPLTNAVVHTPYSVTFNAVNGAPLYHWSSTSLPPGLALDPSTGVLSGTPTNSGNYSFNITVTDSASPAGTATQQFVLRIVDQLTIYPTLAKAVLGQWYYDTISAYGGTGPWAWSIVAGTLPPGISFSSDNGAFSGTPTQLGDFPLTVQVRDSGPPQQTAQAQLTLQVVPPPLILAPSLPYRLPLGIPFEGYAVANGGTPPYTWSLQGASLPSGLSLEASTGRVSGTPDTLGYSSTTIYVTDSGSPAQTAWLNYGITVTTPLGRNDTIAKATPIRNGDTYASISPYADPPDSPSPVPDTDFYRVIGNAGSTVKLEIFARRWNTTALDSVLELVDANGSRLNSCRQPGDLSTNFNSPCMNDDIQMGIVTDSELELKVPGADGTQTTFYAHVSDWRGDARPDMLYYLELTGAVNPLTITTTELGNCATGQPCGQQLGASGGSGTLTWTVDSGSLPPGVSLLSSGSLTGTPTLAGDYSFVLRVTDSASPPQVTTASFSMKVEDPPVITTDSLPDGYTGVPYSFQLTVTGGTPPYYWSGNGGNLNVSVSGVLQGTPNTPGSFTVDVSTNDHLGFSTHKSLPIVIHAGAGSWVPPTPR